MRKFFVTVQVWQAGISKLGKEIADRVLMKYNNTLVYDDYLPEMEKVVRGIMKARELENRRFKPLVLVTGESAWELKTSLEYDGKVAFRLKLTEVRDVFFPEVAGKGGKK